MYLILWQIAQRKFVIYEFLNQAKAEKVSQALAISFIWMNFRFLKSPLNQYPYKLQLQPLNNANSNGQSAEKVGAGRIFIGLTSCL